ncbi:hypothetical protein GKQ38_00500 [Candidatus Nanohaloarchaea archaeon]|nr:hypothetical protein GKQ38_00500 [Candidatus Nanohaloarchaea archaeon]
MVNKVWDELLEGSEKLQTLPGALKFLRKTDSTDNIALMGGNNDYNRKSFADFEETVFKNYSSNNNARIFASEEYQEDVAESDKIHNESVFFFEYPGSSYQISDILANSRSGEETVAFGPKEYLEDFSDFSPDKVKGFYRN